MAHGILFGDLKFGSPFYLPEDHNKARDALTKRLIRYAKIVGKNDPEIHTFDGMQCNAIGRQDIKRSKQRLSVGILLADDQTVIPLDL